jgi:uncharacterized membrane protein
MNSEAVQGDIHFADQDEELCLPSAAANNYYSRPPQPMNAERLDNLETIKLPELNFKIPDSFLVAVDREEDEESSQVTRLTVSTANSKKSELQGLQVQCKNDDSFLLAVEENEDKDKDAISQMSDMTYSISGKVFEITRPESVRQSQRIISARIASGRKEFYKVHNNSSVDSGAYESFCVTNNREEMKVSWSFLRIIGILLIVLSIVELGIGAKIENTIVNQSSGSWWAGVVAVIAGACAIVSPWNVNLMIATSLLVSSAIVSSVVGAFIDGVSAQTYLGLVACARQEEPGTEQFSFYGATTDPTTTAAAALCYNEYSVSNPSKFDCVCINSQNHCTYDLELSHSTDCAVILDDYPQMLFGSMIVCIGLAILCLVAAIISCYNVWHKEETKKVQKKISLQTLSMDITQDIE